MTTPVLIVGAGPVGLAAGCELLRLGVPVRILDAAADRPKGTRALQLWPPALDVLRGLGLLDAAESRGLRVRTMSYHLAAGRRLKVALGSANEPLLLPQEQTNALLEERLEELGGKVERSAEVTEVRTRADGVSVEVRGPAGTETVRADWLIAADGVRSRVREQLGIEFAGDRVPMTFLLAEGSIVGSYESGHVHYFFGRTGALVFAPMRNGNVRIAAAVPGDTPLTPESVQTLLDERGPGGLRVGRLDALRTFTSSERIAVPLRRGRCFLVGDAAHTHSPVGGQGLNLGLQDVHNLAWKLAAVIQGRLTLAILDSYEHERRQAAEQIVHTTHQMIRMFTLGPAAARVRNLSWRGLDATGVLRRWFVPLLAGWRIRYSGSLSADGSASRLPSRGPALLLKNLPPAGARTPHWVPRTGPDVQSAFRLLTLGPPAGALVRRGRAMAARRSGLLTHDHLPRRGAGFLLLRPDGYVAASGTTPSGLERVEDLLDRLTTTQRSEA
ncbi:FAD-dependent monooxygenase [Streptomyces sp. NPDC048324]|uniref:FAD-dependent oxidoreductase n=1 Tax=Streptomyces sp. NPDC048324 TaxID=3157205 RepID=UPI003445D3C5